MTEYNTRTQQCLIGIIAAAKILGYSTCTVRKMAKDGAIPAWRATQRGKWRFDANLLAEHVKLKCSENIREQSTLTIEDSLNVSTKNHFDNMANQTHMQTGTA